MENITEVVPECTEVINEVIEEPITEVLTPEAIDQMVKEAEERGYVRGRNEAVDALMDRPGYGGKQPECVGEDDGEDAVMILREMRRSVWE